MDNFASRIDLSFPPFSFSLNTLVINGNMQDIIPLSRGRISITYPDIPSDATLIFGYIANRMKLWGGVSHVVLPQAIVTSSIQTKYNYLAAGPDTTFCTSSPSHLTENALRIMPTSVRKDDNNDDSNSVPNDATSQDEVDNSTNIYQLKKYIRTQSLVVVYHSHGPVRDIYNLFLNDPMDSSPIRDPIMSSWGRSSATYFTRHSLKMNHSSSSHSVCNTVTCALGRGYAKSLMEWGVIPAKDTTSCDICSFRMSALVASGTHHIPFGWRKNTATFTTYPEYLLSKFLSDAFFALRMYTSNTAGLFHSLSEPLKFFANFFAMTMMVCLSSSSQVIYPPVILHFGDLLRSIVTSTSLDSIEMLIRSAVGEMKSIVPNILKSHRLIQARQYSDALTVPFGTHYQAVSLKLESLSPKFDAYTFQDDVDVEDPTGCYDGLKIFYEEGNNSFCSSYNNQVRTQKIPPSSRTFHALHNKSMPDAEYAHISDACILGPRKSSREKSVMSIGQDSIGPV